MRRNLPPLNSLRAFDAAGRLLSFSNAARELKVTQGAVSRQIRALERQLGVKLFVRLTRRVELTEVGQAFLRDVQFALDHIERAVRNSHPRKRHRVLTISVLPSVATFWLMPRLAAFTMSHPNIEIRILTSIEPVDLLGGEADLAIRVGPLPGKHYEKWQPKIDLEMVLGWRGVHAEYLFPDVLMPFCSPSILTPQRPLQHPNDLKGYPLIHTATRSQAWPDWFRAQGLEIPTNRNSVGYGHFFMSIQAARNGSGIGIAPKILFLGHEAKGLLFPFERAIPSAGEYYLLTLDKRRDEGEMALFRSWITREAQRHIIESKSPRRPTDIVSNYIAEQPKAV